MPNQSPETVIIYLERGRVWPCVTVARKSTVEVIVVNNDQHTMWRAKKVVHPQKEIDEIVGIVDLMEKQEEVVAHILKRENKK